MMRIIEGIATPQFVVSALVILVGAVVILRLTKPKPPPSIAGRYERTGTERPVAGSSAEPVVPTLSSSHPGVTFADVAGLENAIAELREAKEYLSDPRRFQALGAEMPKGILLHGAPGCGKTLLAKALAGETGVPFFFVSAASFVEQYVGLGAARVRQLFEEAKRHAPSIVFIDELDAIGRMRKAGNAGEREFDNTLNQLLIELDGFQGSAGVLILGATNRPELIDPALLRAGRFDRRIEIDRPDREGREQILRLHASRRPCSARVDWAHVAAHTAGLSPAELANLVNEAALLAARRHRQVVAPEDVEEAAARGQSGTRSSRLLDDDEKEIVSVHEAGHALLSLLVKGMTPPARISIVNRSGNSARSNWSSVDDRAILTKRELMAQLIVLLGGRAAEVNTFGEPSNRAEDDLRHAADLAQRMVGRWGMTGRFELAGRGPDAPAHHLEGTPSSHEVREILSRSEQAARVILRDNGADLVRVARVLAKRETITRADLEELTGRGRRSASVHQLAADRTRVTA